MEEEDVVEEQDVVEEEEGEHSGRGGCSEGGFNWGNNDTTFNNCNFTNNY